MTSSIPQIWILLILAWFPECDSLSQNLCVALVSSHVNSVEGKHILSEEVITFYGNTCRYNKWPIWCLIVMVFYSVMLWVRSKFKLNSNQKVESDTAPGNLQHYQMMSYCFLTWFLRTRSSVFHSSSLILNIPLSSMKARYCSNQRWYLRFCHKKGRFSSTLRMRNHGVTWLSLHRRDWINSVRLSSLGDN